MFNKQSKVVETEEKVNQSLQTEMIKNSLSIKVYKVSDRAKLPERMTAGSAGFDLYAVQGYTIAAGAQMTFPCGICLEIPEGYEGQIRPRSSLTEKRITAPFGTIDSDYRGEITVLLENRTPYPQHIALGDRIAQLVIQKLPDVAFEYVENLTQTERAGGFGSTGK